MCQYRNVLIIFSLHTEMDENRCTNGLIRVANYTTFVHRFTSVSNVKITKTFIIIKLRIKNTFAKKMPFYFEKKNHCEGMRALQRSAYVSITSCRP